MTTADAPSPSAGTTLIFGAGGFIGANLMRAFMERKCPVIGVLRNQSRSWRAAHLRGAHFIEADITQPDSIARVTAMAKPTTIINAASYGVAPHERDATTMRKVNVDAIETLLDAAAGHGVARFIHLGSCSEYGDVQDTVAENTPLNPKDSYGETKAQGSRLLEAKPLSSSLSTVVLRLFNIWGPFESAHRLVPSIIRNCRTQTALDLTAGTQRKDYSFATDVADWIAEIALLHQKITEPVINCASGQMIAVKELVHAVAARLGGADLMRFGVKAIPQGEVQSGPVDTGIIDRLLPRRKITSLDAAVSEMIASPEAPQ